MKIPLEVCKELLPGKSITKIRHLGSGKMGNVYKVSFNNEESICVKILTKNHYTKSADSDGWKCAYDHFDFNFRCYEDNKYFYFTMPYFEGQPFHYAIRYNLISRFQIIQNLIKEITNIHRKEIIHLDLTCNNIIINKAANQVNIIDFGKSLNIPNFHNSNTAKNPIYNQQSSGQNTITSNILRVFQPYTAPEYFNNDSTIGVQSDYYSFAQLFKLLIPEYAYLANKILITEGINRNTAFSEFCGQINEIIENNIDNPQFYENERNYPSIYFLYKRIIFFIKEIFCRIFDLIFQASDSTFKKTTEPTKLQYIGPVLFKQSIANNMSTLNIPLKTNATL